MKRKVLCFVMMLLLMAGSVMTVRAEEHKGDDKWAVEFNGEEMVSNFTTGNLSDVILAMQPGDRATITLGLKNSADFTTDWYMTNKVLSSLEDSQSVANGGAYTYILTYTNNAGEVNTLYSSESVGGEKQSGAGEGLHEATDSLKDYLYLDRLNAGESGKITLVVALDGDTLGNAYQNTLADLQMNFAVERVTATPGTSSDETPNSGRRGDKVVRTGDNSPLTMWAAVSLVSGLLILVVAIIRWKRSRDSRERRMRHE